MHTLFLIFGSALIALTAPLLCELALITVGNLLPRRRANSALCDHCAHELQFTGPIAILIPAHNEELLIRRSAASAFNAAGYDPELNTRVIVIAHNCSDQTAARAASLGVEVLPFNDLSAQGKGHALRHGFNEAMRRNFAAVIVVDADSVVKPTLVSAMRNALGNSDAAQCRYELSFFGTSNKSATTRLQTVAFRAMNVIRARGRSRLGLSCGIFGNGFAVRTSLLRKLPYAAFTIAEDLEYHLQLVLARRRVAFTDSAIVYGPAATRTAAVAQRSRWEGGRLNLLRSRWPRFVAGILRGKLRLIEPVCDLASLPLALGVTVLALTLLIPIAPIRIYAAAGLALILLHVLMAASAGPDFFGTLRLLAKAPLYIIWKLSLSRSIARASRKKATWVRTGRANTLAISHKAPDVIRRTTTRNAL
jgi:cellulose synthase/poly-beta-1,6-N-acetylglucosamine synthase-like glycosyltransferase